MKGSAVFRSQQNGGTNYFGKLKFVLKLVGVSLKGDEGAAYKVYSFLLIFFIMFLYPLLDSWVIFKQDFEVVANAIMYPFATVLAFTKTMLLLRKRIKLGKLLDKLEREPFLPNVGRGGEVEGKLMEDCAWIINAQTLLYWVASLATVSVAAIIALTKRIKSDDYHDWEFPFGPFDIVNVTYSPNYEISWLYQTLSVLIISIHFTTFDLVSAAVLVHVAFHFKILQNNIRRIVDISYVEMLKETGSTNSSVTQNSTRELDGPTIPWKYLRKSLTQAINYHLAIIGIADEIEDLFSGLLLFAFLNSLSILCFLVYHGTRVTSADSRLLVNDTGGALIVCGLVFTICFWGEQVTNESEEVGRAAFEANFVGADLRFQKSLVLIIRRSKYRTVLTAGKFSVIGLSTFTWMLRTTYSAFAMLRNTNQ